MGAQERHGALRVVVLVSGSGTLLQALLDTAGAGFAVVAVGADRAGATGLDRARTAGVPTFVERVADHPEFMGDPSFLPRWIPIAPCQHRSARATWTKRWREF